ARSPAGRAPPVACRIPGGRRPASPGPFRARRGRARRPSRARRGDRPGRSAPGRAAAPAPCPTAGAPSGPGAPPDRPAARRSRRIVGGRPRAARTSGRGLFLLLARGGNVRQGDLYLPVVRVAALVA